MDDFNKDELEPPQWLDNGFFRKVLENSEKPSNKGIEIKNFKLTPASMKGDHYASVMFRATIDYEWNGIKKSKSVIVKTMPEYEGHKKEFLSKTFIFETEVGMYTEVLPRIEKILRAAGDNETVMAPCLYYELSPRKLIVFEDLVPLGYSVLRDRVANREEVEGAYRKLAKLHAVSLQLNQQDPEFFRDYHRSMMSMSHFVKDDMMVNGVKYFMELLAESPRLHRFKPFFHTAHDTLFPKAIAAFKEYTEAPQEHAYYVLCHGDFHLKNMMFKRNPSNGQLEDVMLLDFQISYMGNITLDLMYSYCMLLDKEMRRIYPQYLYYYYTQLRKTLKKINYEGQVPKLSELYEQRRQRRHVELLFLSTFLPMWYGMREGKNEPEKILTDNDLKRQLYRDEEYVKDLEEQLERYLYAGYLEDL